MVNGEVVAGEKDLQITISDINRPQEIKAAFRVGNTTITEIDESNIRFFPVPARTRLQVVSEKMMHQVSLANIMGQKVYVSQNAGLSHSIDAGNLKTGIYVLKVRTGSGLVSRKVQVE